MTTFICTRFTFLAAVPQPEFFVTRERGADRVLPFPFFFLDSNHAMNVKPLNYEWQDFYRQSADVTRYAFTGARVWRGALRLTAA